MFMLWTVLIMLTRPVGEGTEDAPPTDPPTDPATLEDMTAETLAATAVDTAADTAADICCIAIGSSTTICSGDGGGG